MENDLIKKCVDSRGVILSMENQMLFRGKISRYDAVNDVIRVEANNGCAVRGLVDTGDRVKLQVKENSGDKRFVLIEGVVEQAMQDFIFLTPVAIEEKSEDRAYLRQNVMVGATVIAADQAEKEAPCMIADVSATGISIQSGEEYPIGAHLRIQGQRLRQNGPVHTMEFVVLRKSAQNSGKYHNFYGCRFENMPSDEQDRLFQDIFTLQALELRSSKNR